MKLTAYIKNEITEGRFPTIMIEAGEFGTFWMYDGDWKILDCKTLTSRESAENLRSKAIEAGTRKYAA